MLQTSLRVTPEEKRELFELAHDCRASINTVIRAALADLVSRHKTSPHTVRALVDGFRLGTPEQDR